MESKKKLLNNSNQILQLEQVDLLAWSNTDGSQSKEIPTLIQEQNSFPGITNRYLGKKANTICIAYDHLERFFPKEKLVKTGNPVRADLLYIHKKLKINASRELFELKKKRKTVLVLGGSLGARKINELIASNIPLFKAQKTDNMAMWATVLR